MEKLLESYTNQCVWYGRALLENRADRYKQGRRLHECALAAKTVAEQLCDEFGSDAIAWQRQAEAWEGRVEAWSWAVDNVAA